MCLPYRYKHILCVYPHTPSHKIHEGTNTKNVYVYIYIYLYLGVYA